LVWTERTALVEQGNKETESLATATDTSSEEVLLEAREDDVYLVTLNRPKANALSLGVLGKLEEYLRGLSRERPGAVILWGGPRIFAAGADVEELAGLAGLLVRGARRSSLSSSSEAQGQPEGSPSAPARDMGPTSEDVSLAFERVGEAIALLPCMVIAAINGYALGGGLELAMATDYRIAGENARVGQPEILLGIIPGGGGTQRLPRLVGVSRAKELILTGRQLLAQEALAMGLVDEVVADEQVLERALQLGSQLAKGPRHSQMLAKHAIRHAMDMPLASGLALEREAFAVALSGDEARTGLASFFENGPGKAVFRPK
jgi:enoyl-CoA hydratase/carnithine racemase